MKSFTITDIGNPQFCIPIALVNKNEGIFSCWHCNWTHSAAAAYCPRCGATSTIQIDHVGAAIRILTTALQDGDTDHAAREALQLLTSHQDGGRQ